MALRSEGVSLGIKILQFFSKKVLATLQPHIPYTYITSRGIVCKTAKINLISGIITIDKTLNLTKNYRILQMNCQLMELARPVA
jgi:hypothetical protein